MPYIYLIHCRTSVNSKENVYKIGKTEDYKKRFSSYPKGSIPLFLLYVNDHDTLEKNLIEIFTNKFIKRKDYGDEYFEGNITEMINTILDNYTKVKEQQEYKQVVNTKEKKTLTHEELQIKKIQSRKFLLNKLNRINKKNVSQFSTDLSALDSRNMGDAFGDYENIKYLCGQFGQLFIVNNIEPEDKKFKKFGDYIQAKKGWILDTIVHYSVEYSDVNYINFYKNLLSIL